MRATLTRAVTFSAAHRYRRPEWDDARNREVFGACAHPNWHGHTYTCEVTVGGEIDSVTGFCADLGALDRALAERVVAVLDHRNLVLDVPAFAEGALIPTGENIAWWVAHEVQTALGPSARVERVRISEMPGLWVEIVPA
ncbi:MAG: 6-carboxytetrahydropterin synthase [Gemmatimonadota bacterium]|jgi:6-pyruvoyltetrahydropterin/6-carboxytetrahydropterin synthase|nr:6-carboxytetrahydropterin synthase [Gemmatimonadota bacterium]MDQ8177415.1 6-carboxytetrahydropterin synthase [Gemmatimonadota bacterium]